jgi:DNA-binding NtrC family response regulator
MPPHFVANANVAAKQALKPAQLGTQALQSAFSHSVTKHKSNGVTQRHSRLAALAANLQESCAVVPGSFREAKSLLVSQFERDYITHALDKHNGNIAMAARASQKHRRAFWALMRKYDIEAQAYRADDEQG